MARVRTRLKQRITTKDASQPGFSDPDQVIIQSRLLIFDSGVADSGYAERAGLSGFPLLFSVGPFGGWMGPTPCGGGGARRCAGSVRQAARASVRVGGSSVDGRCGPVGCGVDEVGADKTAQAGVWR